MDATGGVEGNPARVPFPTGVLPDHELRAAVEAGWISAVSPLADAQFQPASLDLRLGPVAYQLRASFLPYRESVQDRLDGGDGDLVIDRLSLTEGATLQRGSVYLVPLLESLALPPGMRGRSKSSRASSRTARRASTRSPPVTAAVSTSRSRRSRSPCACTRAPR
jgi:dCTP deaminase